MRVTLISGEYPPMRGGVADYTALLAAALAQPGVDVDILTSTRASGHVAAAGPRVFPVVQAWGAHIWRVAFDHIQRTRPDVLHVQYQTGAFDMKVGVNLLPWLCRFQKGRPKVVVTFHDLKEPYLLPKLGRSRHAATHLIAAGADAVIATNSEDFRRLGGGDGSLRTSWLWGKRRLRPIPIGSNIPDAASDGFDREFWRTRVGIREGEVAIAYFGFLNPSKGVETLVSAFEKLVQRGRPVRLLMIGATAGATGSPDRRYENRIRQLLDQPIVRGHVGWTGFVQASDVARYLRASDLCVLPFRDGFSMRHGTLVAAIANNLPIVTTNRPRADHVGIFPELHSEENALLVPPDDSEALAVAIERVVSDGELRRRLSSEVIKLAEAFRWSAIAAQTLRLYREIAGVI